ncbi:hypothetical protein BKA69DRAFT_489726 [Paraphysoderma sedebokerense]|nr:hypothetical protein BKA69DRAFT_489726 [Paraphysoderma sedebokerense]
MPILTSENGSSPASHLPHHPSFIPRRVDGSSMHNHNHLQSQLLQPERQRDSSKINNPIIHRSNLPVLPHASSLTKTSSVSPEQTSFRLPSLSFSAISRTHINSNSPNHKQIMSKQTSKQLATNKFPLLVPFPNTRTSQSSSRRDKISNASTSTVSTLSNSYQMTSHNLQQQESAAHIPRLSDIVLNPKMPSDLTVGLQTVLTANSLSSPHKSPLQKVEARNKVKEPERAYAGIIFRGKLMEDADDTKPMNLTSSSLIPDRIDNRKSNVKGRKPVGLLKP